MKTLTTLALLIFVLNSFSQPSSFSWYSDDEDEHKNYISPAKDQCEQGPCGIFATVASVEALSHIYFNKPFTHSSNGINLAEAEIYSECVGFGRYPEGSASTENTLNYIDTYGIINEACFEFPDTCFRKDCDAICENPVYEVNIPGFEQFYPSSNQDF
ncbi:MAG: hypothetical protein HQ541_16330 [Mariniphaga sp.]|nr:hypothetical protein [Mariniphaga sp.]